MTRVHTAQRGRGRARYLLAALSIGALALTGLAATASAQTVPCQGDVVVAIDGVRLLNRDGARQAGPYLVQLDAGRYRIDAASFDYHTPDQITQPNEQWQVITNSGWGSGFTIDIPDNEQTTYTIFPDNTLPATSSIILSHRSIGNINSVNPVCVSFTRLDDPGSDASDPESDDPEGPQTPDDGGEPDDDEPGTDEPAEPAEPDGSEPDGSDPEGEDPDGEPDDGDDPNEPNTDEPDDGDDPDGDDPDGDDPDGDDPSDTTTSPPADDGEPDDSDEPEVVSPPASDDDGDDPIEPEVQGKVEEPGATPALARTGPEDITWRLFGIALMFIGLGGLAVRRAAPSIIE